MPLVEPGVDDHDVDAHRLHLPRHRDLVGAEHDVAHHVAVVLARRAHGLADRVLVRLAHHDHERRAALEHHLGLEVPGVHRFQVRDDRMVRVAPCSALTACRPSPRMSGVPTSSQSTPARTAISAVGSASATSEIERELDLRRAVESCGFNDEPT